MNVLVVLRKQDQCYFISSFHNRHCECGVAAILLEPLSAKPDWFALKQSLSSVSFCIHETLHIKCSDSAWTAEGIIPRA
jgi:hypothetical protein